MSDTPATATRAQFARLQGWRPSYVTQLARDGRLVFADKAQRLVDVAASVQRIRDTMDPSRAAVAERHAAARQHGPAAEAGTAGRELRDEAPDDVPGSIDYQQWRARAERAKALAAERDLEVSLGRLIAIDAVAAQVRLIVMQFAQGLETCGDTIAQRISPEMGEDARRAIIHEEHTLLREALARALHGLAKGESA
jgi:hypothetical protein